MVAARGAHWACFERSLSVDGSYGWQRVGRLQAQMPRDGGLEPKRVRFDEDLWLIELDVAEPERFIVETGLKVVEDGTLPKSGANYFHAGASAYRQCRPDRGATIGNHPRRSCFIQHAERPVHRPSDGLHVRAHPACFAFMVIAALSASSVAPASECRVSGS